MRKTLYLLSFAVVGLLSISMPASAETDAAVAIRCPAVVQIVWLDSAAQTAVVRSDIASASLCNIAGGCTTTFVSSQSSTNNAYVNYVWTQPVTPAGHTSATLTYALGTTGNVLAYALCVV